MSFLNRLPIDGFMLGMLTAVALAALAPQLGTHDGPLHAGLVTTLGVGLVFFLNGAGLSARNLREGAANWRLHLLVQGSTYLLFPLLGLLIVSVGAHWLPQELRVGLFFLCALPSTISTSIAMTSLARGNIAGAVFNATCSSLLGMLLTPVIVGLWMHVSGHGASLGEQLLHIAEELFLPFAAGQLARPLIGNWIAARKKYVSKVDRGVILLIVWSAFCDSTAAGLWRDNGAAALLQVLAVTGTLLALALSITTWVARRLDFPVEDEITAVFCGSKKSLANGIPMAQLMFTGMPQGLIVLPIMFYHQLQLLVCSALARRYSRRESPAEAGVVA